MNKSNRRKMIISFLVEHSGKVGAPGSVLLIAILWVFYERAESILVKIPTNTTVIVNQSAFFNCSKSGNKSEQLTWHHHAVDGKAEGVFETGSIRGAYKGRFDIDINITSGTFNLLVQRPEPSDAGRYVCLEDPLEKDPGAPAELTVLDSDLVCVANMALHEIIGSTQCDKTIPSDEPLLSCSVTYSGNIAPQIKWINDEMASESMKTECNTTGNRVMCNTTLNTNLIKDGSVFVCQLATAKQYNCSLKVNRTIYTFSDNFVRNITLMDDASCFANTSAELSCSYKWHMDNQTVQLGHKLKTNKSGIYRCEAECKIRNETCAFTAKHINILESALAITSSWNGGLLSLLIIPLAAFAVLAYFVWKKRRAGRTLSNGIVVYQQVQQPVHQQPVHQQPVHQQPGPSADIESANKALLSAPSSTEPITVQEPVHQPLKPLVQSPGPSADIEPVHEALLSVPSNPERKDDLFKDSENVLIRRGLSGAIRGPVRFKDEELLRVYEKIEFREDQRIAADEEEMSETQKTVYLNGLKWKALDHDNLIKFYQVEVTYRAMYIVMENATMESLREALVKRRPMQTIETVKNWAIQIANGIKYLHENNIVHKDIKSTQIFIVESPDKTTLKIACFNLFGDDSANDASSLTERLAYAPPDEHPACSYDVWCFGVVFWELLTESVPYKNTSAFIITSDAKKGAEGLKIPDWCHEDVKNILAGCRIVDSSKRPPIVEILRRLQELQQLKRE